ncbi:uncharacterized protein JN550_000228 [Neoarthrinium moseri]|uniref:uncharacterized protein n=1 Tax=Neoarthrinium moseri TaxID=1658444 RepID=UPI001FDC00FF|nr:uncharacterized protein JN550_000228 [Neoarthrinium moseri]KAI1878046.1 hypothetical protein JN550_000228 [Neoarthrinium moseri]
MASPSPSTLVLGAGELGLATLKALAAHPKRQGGSITVLLRPSSTKTDDADKQKQNAYLASLGVAFEAGDIQDNSISELAAIFKRYHTIVSCTGMYQPRGTQLKISQAVLEAGVPRYFPWQYGIDYDTIGAGSSQDLFDEQLEVRALLWAQTAVNWIIVSTGLFMSFLFVPAFGPVDLQGRVLRGLGGWDTPVSVTSPADIGKMVAEIVYDPRDIGRQVVFVAGDTVTYGRVAELVEQRFGGEWRKEVWRPEFLQRRLAEEPDNTMFKYQNVFAAGKGVAWVMAKTVNGQRGIELENLQAFLRNMEA